jgi:hypothetical protein
MTTFTRRERERESAPGRWILGPQHPTRVAATVPQVPCVENPLRWPAPMHERPPVHSRRAECAADAPGVLASAAHLGRIVGAWRESHSPIPRNRPGQSRRPTCLPTCLPTCPPAADGRTSADTPSRTSRLSPSGRDHPARNRSQS